MRVRYFATTNLRAPFVAVLGHWPDRSSLVRNSLINGVNLGSRPALDCEIAWSEARPERHMFMYWPSLHSMLWVHRGSDLIEYYPALMANIRKQLWKIKQASKELEKKRRIKDLKNAATIKVVEQNKLRIARALQ